MHLRWGCSYFPVAKNNRLKFLMKLFCFAELDWQLLTRAAVFIQSNVMFHPHVLRHLSVPTETSFVCRELRTAIVAVLLMDGIISLISNTMLCFFFHLKSFYSNLHVELPRQIRSLVELLVLTKTKTIKKSQYSK